jgi:hypothetical protein
LVLVAALLIYRFGRHTGESIGSAQACGGMSVKYSRLLSHILQSHENCRIVVETRTYIRVGVSNYGGTTMFHIQQCPGNVVMIDYDVTGNPVFGKFSLRFTFPDSLDQDIMMERISEGVQRKMAAY